MGYRSVFIKNGDKLKLKLDNLEILKGGDSYFIPLEDIETIVLEGNRTIITSLLLAKCAEYHISVIVTDRDYLPNGVFLGLGNYHHSAKRASWQSQWDEKSKLKIWTEVVRQKVHNQLANMIEQQCNQERITHVAELSQQIEFGDKTNREGHIAKMYFNSLFGAKFSRENDCIENACMDYGYAIVRAQVARSITSQGLLPMLGIFHRNEYNSYNLADDLMEPFRPILDWYILTIVLKEKPEYLTYDLRLQLVDFLNQSIYVEGRRCYMNQAINTFVLSFIKAMETNDVTKLKIIDLNNME